MAKVTWLGEGDEGPEETTAFNTAFKKGEAVEVDEKTGWLARAASNRFFKIEGYTKPPPDEAEREPAVHVPPSQQTVPGPVPKGGEPVIPEAAKPPAVKESGVQSAKGTAEGGPLKPVPLHKV